jgi:triphosphatase
VAAPPRSHPNWDRHRDGAPLGDPYTSIDLLRHTGLTLRVRQRDNQWIQTLKTDRTLEGGVSKAFEIEGEVEKGEPALGAIRDKKWRRKVTDLVRQSELAPVFETKIERTMFLREVPTGATIEIALDRGTVTAGGRKEQLKELEVELKSGEPGAVLDVAREFISTGPFQPSRYTKADRGYRLASGDLEEPHRAVKAERPDITTSTGTEAAIVQLCGVATKHISSNWRALTVADDPDAAHQMRIGLRRFRTMLRLLESIFDGPELARLNTIARDLGRDVGQVRDLHVLATELITPLCDHTLFAEGIAKLKADLWSASKLRRRDLLNKFQGSEYGYFQLEIGLLPEIVGSRAQTHGARVEQHFGRLANRTIRKLIRRVGRRGRHLSQLSVEERHELRKAIKPLRYALEFFASLYPKAKAEQFLASIIEMQEALGYLNDVALAETLEHVVSTEAGADPAVQRAIGAVIGWHAAGAATAWKEFPQAWHEFERAAKHFES